MNENQSKLISSALQDFSTASKKEISANTPAFVKTAKEMFTREKLETGFVTTVESFFKTLDEHPLEVSFGVVGTYVAAVTTGLLLFAR